MIINGYFIGFAGTSERKKSDKHQLLAETIGEEIMKKGHRLVSGGCSGGYTQLCAQKAASCLKDKTEERHRIISILPDPTIEQHPSISFGNIFMCKDLSRLERRPFMASLIDSLITIEGSDGTKKEIESCLDVGTPVIPIWKTSGASSEMWEIIEPRLNDSNLENSPPYCFYKGNGIAKKIEKLGKVNLKNQEQIGKLAVDIAIELAKKKHKCRCATTLPKTNNIAFIIMPFDKEFDKVYFAIKEIFEKGIYDLPVKFDCIRHDELRSGKIDESLSQYISEASLLIVDVTGNNPNVLCEYGIGVGFRKKQILINQSPKGSAADIANEIQIQYDPSNLSKLQEDLVNTIRIKFAVKND